jgi:hypothetical protein
LFIWPVYQSDPSFVARGSCGREPGVGNCHDLIITCAGPGTITAAGCPFTGKFFARYGVNVSISSFERATP